MKKLRLDGVNPGNKAEIDKLDKKKQEEKLSTIDKPADLEWISAAC